jgi:Na+/H+-translocating membrane pyrophosphatase
VSLREPPNWRLFRFFGAPKSQTVPRTYFSLAEYSEGLEGVVTTFLTGYIMLDMKWTADRRTIFAAIAAVAAGYVQIALLHNLVLGYALFGLGVLLTVRAFFYFRSK